MIRTEKKIEGCVISEAFSVDEVTHTFGKGGVHSQDAPGVFEACARMALLCFDIPSFYPSVIRNHELVPEHLPRHAFLKPFGQLHDMRLEAKRTGNKRLASSLKIPLNSCFGKSGSPYGWLTDPTALVRCTMMGELTLCTFIQAMHDRKMRCLSANTDGCVLMCERERIDEVIHYLDRVAKAQNLTLEWEEWSRYARRSISDYAVLVTRQRDDRGVWRDVPEDQQVKTKGCFLFDLEGMEAIRHKNAMRIVPKAATLNLMRGVPIADTVRACTDPAMFADHFRPGKRGWHLESTAGVGLGGIARWILARGDDTIGIVSVAPDGRRISKIEGGALLCNRLPEVLPDCVDLDAYIERAQELVSSVLDPPEVHETQIPVGELSTAQRTLLTHDQKTKDPDEQRVADALLDLDWARTAWTVRSKGSRYASGKSIMVRIWKASEGALTRGDLEALVLAIDDEGYFSGSNRRTLRDMLDWCVRAISPFRMPQTTEEVVARAACWAMENVEPAKRKSKLSHERVTKSSWLSGEALRHYGRTRNAYKLACHIASKWRKHRDSPPDEAFIIDLLAECDEYFSDQPIATTESQPQESHDDAL